MRRKIQGKLISMFLAATMALSSVVPSYAAEDAAGVLEDDAAGEPQEEELSELETSKEESQEQPKTPAEEDSASLEDEEAPVELFSEEPEELEEYQEEPGLLEEPFADGENTEEYIVYFNTEEGAFVLEKADDQIQEISIGDYIPFPSPADVVKPGYILSGWKSYATGEIFPAGDGEFIEGDAVLSKDLIDDFGDADFEAQWEKIESFRLRVFDNVTTLSLTTGEVYPKDLNYYIPLNNRGRYFEGWMLDSEFVIPERTVVTAPQSDFIAVKEIEGASAHPFREYVPVISLEAVSALIKYDVTFHLNLGGRDVSTHKTYTTMDESIPLDLAAADLSGNSSTEAFDKWIDGDGNEYGDDATVKDVIDNYQDINTRTVSVDLYAQWSATDMYYTIVFDPNGGSGTMDPIKVLFNQEVEITNKFTRTGYDVISWNTAKDGSGRKFEVEVDDIATVKNVTLTNHAKVTLYAQWEPEETDISVYTTDPERCYTEKAEYGKPIDPYDLMRDPHHNLSILKDGYYVKGWNTKDKDGNLQPVDLTVPYDGSYDTIYADFEPIEYKVTYHSNFRDADYTKELTYKVTDDDYIAVDPAKITYASVFEGNEKAIKAAEEMEILAWDLKSGSVASEFTEKELLSKLIDPYGKDAEAAFDVYARWAPEEPYTVVFVAGEGAEGGAFPVSEITVGDKKYYGYKEEFSIGETIVLSGNEFVKKGYSITGWSYANGKGTTKLKAEAAVKDLPVTGDDRAVIVNSIWSTKEDTYKVTYNLDGGKVSSGKLSTSYRYSTGYELPTNIVKDGYTFGGWYSDLYFQNEVTALGRGGEVETGNVTLYAKLIPNSYIINLDPNNGVDDTVILEVGYGEVVDLSLYQFEYAGRKFSKWLLKDTSKKYGAKDKVKNLTKTSGGEVTLIARWNDVKNKITYNYEGGSKVKNPSTYLSSSFAIITEPVRYGYKFVEWVVEPQSSGEARIEAVTEGENAGKWKLTGTDSVTLTAVWRHINYDFEFYRDGTVGAAPAYTFEDLWIDEEMYPEDWVEAAIACGSEDTNGVKGFSRTPGASKPEYDINKTYKLSDICKNIKQPEEGDVIVKLYAVYDASEKYYYIEYDLNEYDYWISGVVLSKNIYTFKKSASVQALPKAVAKGYSFIKWTTGDEEKDARVLTADGTKIAANVAENLYLKPLFESNTYTVTFDFKGAVDTDTGKKLEKKVIKNVDYHDGTYEVKAIEDGKEIIRRVEAYAPDEYGVKDGYMFMGYSYGSGKDQKILQPGDVLRRLTDKSGVTYSAVWEPVGSSVIFSESVIVDGKDSKKLFLDTSSFKKFTVYGDKAYTLPKPKVKGYTFLGWRLVTGIDADLTYDRTGNYVTRINSKNQRGVSLKACFTENTYTLKLDFNGGFFKYPGNDEIMKVWTIDEPVKYSDDVTEVTLVQNFMGLAGRKGYNLKGTYLTLDKAGKKPVTNGRYVTDKNKATVTFYVQWEKVKVLKPKGVSAIITSGSEGEKYLMVDWKNRQEFIDSYYWDEDYIDNMVEVQYSRSPIFLYGNSSFTAYPDDKEDLGQKVNGDRYYVRVRMMVSDSAGEYVYGPWSTVVSTGNNTQN